MHKAVKVWCSKIKGEFPEFFKRVNVLDVGSRDINGTNRYLFEDYKYTGIDIMEGKNVDCVINPDVPVYGFANSYDVVISTEMLEHDSTYAESLKKMYKALRHDGLLIVTAAGTKRKEHGTRESSPGDSPGTQDYYKNITVRMLCRGLSFANFSWFEISYQDKDIRFAGIKR